MICLFLFAEMGERCTFKDDDDCSFSFSYEENPGKDVVISVQKEKGILQPHSDKNEFLEVLAVYLAPEVVHQAGQIPTKPTAGVLKYW